MKQITTLLTTAALVSACSQVTPEKVAELVSTTQKRENALLQMRKNDMESITRSWLYEKTTCPTIFVTPDNNRSGNYRKIIKIHPVIIGNPKEWEDNYYQLPTIKAINWIMENDKTQDIEYWYHPKSSLSWRILTDEFIQSTMPCNYKDTQSWSIQSVIYDEHVSWLSALANK